MWELCGQAVDRGVNDVSSRKSCGCARIVRGSGGVGPMGGLRVYHPDDADDGLHDLPTGGRTGEYDGSDRRFHWVRPPSDMGFIPCADARGQVGAVNDLET